jgi:hypothetical protein
MKNNAFSRLSVLALAGLFLTGCSALRDAFLDRDSTLAPLESATLGHTSRGEILRQLGEPDEIDARRLDGLPMEVAFYDDSYVDDGNRPHYRILACEFSQGVLTGYAFHDSGEAARNGFNEADRARLIQGKTTRRDAASALGAPHGKALVPTTLTLPALETRIGGALFPLAQLPEGTREVWQYYSRNFDQAAPKASQQTLSVFFDGQGRVIGSSLLQELTVKSP